MKAVKSRPRPKKKPPEMAEIDRIALVLWHTSQLSGAGRTYVLAALATADAILNGHQPPKDRS